MELPTDFLSLGRRSVKDWRADLQHVFREANQVGDALARYGVEKQRGYMKEWHTPPPVACQAWKLDKMGEGGQDQ